MLSDAEQWQLLKKQVRKRLGMSAEEFVRAWRAGEIPNPDRPEVLDVALLIPHTLRTAQW